MNSASQASLVRGRLEHKRLHCGSEPVWAVFTYITADSQLTIPRNIPSHSHRWLSSQLDLARRLGRKATIDKSSRDLTCAPLGRVRLSFSFLSFFFRRGVSNCDVAHRCHGFLDPYGSRSRRRRRHLHFAENILPFIKRLQAWRLAACVECSQACSSFPKAFWTGNSGGRGRSEQT